MPLRVRQWLYHWTLRLTVGDLTRFGLPKPDHRVYETHPIANSQLVYYVGHGGIGPVPDVARFHPYAVELADGREIDPEVVVFATGYLPRFEFLDASVFGDSAGAGRPTLWLNAFTPGHPTLAVAGLLQPDSGLFTLSHWQTVLFARLLRPVGTGRNGPRRSRPGCGTGPGSGTPGRSRTAAGTGSRSGTPTTCAPSSAPCVELEGK